MLATFALILIANEVVRLIWGTQSIMLNAPAGLTGPVELPGGMRYASYRLAIIGVGRCRRGLFFTSWSQKRKSACWCAPAPPTARWRWPWA